MNCIFKGILINSRGSCHSSAAIKGNRTVISRWRTAWRERREEGGGWRRRKKQWLSEAISEVPACSVCIIIELLFRILISARYWFFFPTSAAKSTGIDHLTLFFFFFLPPLCHLLSSSSLQCPTITVLHITLPIGQSWLFCAVKCILITINPNPLCGQHGAYASIWSNKANSADNSI